MNKKNVRKIALKMTASYMAMYIAVQLIVVALLRSLSKLWIDSKSIVIMMIVFNVIWTFVTYADFKEEVSSWLENDDQKEENKPSD